MKKVIQLVVLALVSGIFLTACENGEVVQPGSKSVPNMMEQGATDTIHELPSVICGKIETGALVDQNGNAGSNNFSSPPSYGTWEMFTTPLEMFVDIRLTRGYFMYSYSVFMGTEAGLPTNLNGSPDPTLFPTQGNCFPYRNNLEVRWPTSSQMACPGSVIVVFYATIVELDFLSSPISETNVWMNGTPVGSAGGRKVEFCAAACPAGPSVPCEQNPDLYSACTPIPAVPNPVPTKSWTNGGLNINHTYEVIQIDVNGSMGTANFNSAGTIIIPAGKVVSGGVNANNGGKIIVLGTFNWNGSANLGGNFSVMVGPGGVVNRTGSFNINSNNGLVVNYGTFNLNSDLNSQSPTYNDGLFICNGVNLSGQNGKIINSDGASFQAQQYFNMNNGTRVENCGSIEVGANLEVNSGSTFINRSKLLVRQATHNNGVFENYCNVITGLSGSADGFSMQGTRTVFGNGSSLVTRNFYWATQGKVDLQGDASISVGQVTLNPTGGIAALSGPGTLRINSGVNLVGTGVLSICDIDPLSGSDIPASGTFPTTILNRINTNSYASVSISQCSPGILPMAPVQQAAFGN